MMSTRLLSAVLLFASAAAFAQESSTPGAFSNGPTTAEMLAQLKPAATTRARAPRTNIIYQDKVGASFLIPVVGNTPGQYGTYFHSAVVLSNYRDVDQKVAISILKQGRNSGSLPSKTITLPRYSTTGTRAYVSEDFLADLGETGLAAVVVQAVDATGKADPDGLLDGFSRVWTNEPASGGCTAPTGTSSMDLSVVPTDSIPSGAFPGFVTGLRQDANYRANIGVVNLSDTAHTWYVYVDGSGGQSSFTVTVPGYSMMHVPLPAGTLGTMGIAVVCDNQNSPEASQLKWAAYASSTDNRNGDGWGREASY